MSFDMKNPGALAGATGTDQHMKAGSFRGKNSSEHTLAAMPKQVEPAPQGRAADLAQKMRRLDQIQPALKGRYLVKGWLDHGAASVVYGESNVGKTFFALDLALHVAAGLSWHGRKIAGSNGIDHIGTVIYIASEGGFGIHNRIAAIRRDNPNLLDSANFILLSTGLDLCGATDGVALADAISSITARASLVVIDTLARAMGNGDENSAKDMGAFVRNIDRLRELTGAHVMVIHHSGKDTSKGARGSSSLRAAVDTEIELTRCGAVVMAETRKQRDMPCDKEFAYTLRPVFLGKDEDGDAVTSAVVQETDPVKKEVKLSRQQHTALNALRDAIADHGEMKTEEGYPAGRKCVELSKWREFCDRRSLTNGTSDSAKRKAFFDVKNNLVKKAVIQIRDDLAWTLV